MTFQNCGLIVIKERRRDNLYSTLCDCFSEIRRHKTCLEKTLELVQFTFFVLFRITDLKNNNIAKRTSSIIKNSDQSKMVHHNNRPLATNNKSNNTLTSVTKIMVKVIWTSLKVRSSFERHAYYRVLFPVKQKPLGKLTNSNDRVTTIYTIK